MLFGKKEFCPFCGRKVGLMKKRTSDGVAVCFDCFVYLDIDEEIMKFLSLDAVSERASQRAKNKTLFQKFKPCREVKAGGCYFREDSQLQMWYVTRIKNPDNPTLYRYDEVVTFELKEDGNSVSSGGLGRAVAGGLLFGGAGAIVGAVTGGKTTKRVLSSIDFVISLTNSWRNNITVNFLRFGGKCKSGSWEYKEYMKEASELVNFFNSICGRAKQSAPTLTTESSGATDEIIKFKGLLDKGIITEEEFRQKKKELLGL